ncbi:hypothetical protein [Kushneria phyllosphaerae]|uniref:DUF2188 domain-containing protein n=1 Tax=Kushneria phyllosphaerae TaxID=2100822 RepID=A0A2R8CN10_9GAMM|nr:hypothetical protein [Kushneria phyllosphaerae]SPJ34249.1 hypothetical protein KSP9073_02282 [Kushneria phyllosphaerae]
MSFGYLVKKQNGRWLVCDDKDQIIKRFYTKRTAVQWAEKKALESHVSAKVCKTDGRQDYIFNQFQNENAASR